MANIVKKTLGKAIDSSLDVFGKGMKKTSLKFQFESTLVGYGFVLLSMIFLFGFQIYQAIQGINRWWSLFYALNAFCGILIIYSQLVSTFMSYLQITALTEAHGMLEGITSIEADVKAAKPGDVIIFDEAGDIKEKTI